MSEGQTVAVTTAEGRYTRSPNGPSPVGEPHEEPEAVFDIGRQLRDPTEASQTVPSADTCPRHLPSHTAPEDDRATTLRDRRIAEYEARLQNSRARGSAAYDAGCRDPEPVAATGVGLLRGAGHGYLLHPD